MRKPIIFTLNYSNTDFVLFTKYSKKCISTVTSFCLKSPNVSVLRLSHTRQTIYQHNVHPASLNAHIISQSIQIICLYWYSEIIIYPSNIPPCHSQFRHCVWDMCARKCAIGFDYKRALADRCTFRSTIHIAAAFIVRQSDERVACDFMTDYMPTLEARTTEHMQSYVHRYNISVCICFWSNRGGMAHDDHEWTNGRTDGHTQLINIAQISIKQLGCHCVVACFCVQQQRQQQQSQQRQQCQPQPTGTIWDARPMRPSLYVWSFRLQCQLKRSAQLPVIRCWSMDVGRPQLGTFCLWPINHNDCRNAPELHFLHFHRALAIFTQKTNSHTCRNILGTLSRNVGQFSVRERVRKYSRPILWSYEMSRLTRLASKNKQKQKEYASPKLLLLQTIRRLCVCVGMIYISRLNASAS